MANHNHAVNALKHVHDVYLLPAATEVNSIRPGCSLVGEVVGYLCGGALGVKGAMKCAKTLKVTSQLAKNYTLFTGFVFGAHNGSKFGKDIAPPGFYAVAKSIDTVSGCSQDIYDWSIKNLPDSDLNNQQTESAVVFFPQKERGTSYGFSRSFPIPSETFDEPNECISFSPRWVEPVGTVNLGKILSIGTSEAFLQVVDHVTR